MISKKSTFSVLCDFFDEEEKEELIEKEERDIIKNYREESLLKLSNKILPKSLSDIELGRIENKKYVKNHNFAEYTFRRGLHKKEFPFNEERLYYLSVWIYQAIFKGFLDYKGENQSAMINQYGSKYYESDLGWMEARLEKILKDHNVSIFDLQKNWEGQNLYWSIKQLKKKIKIVNNADLSTAQGRRMKVKYEDEYGRIFLYKRKAVKFKYFKDIQSIIPNNKITFNYMSPIKHWKYLSPAIINKLKELKCLRLDYFPGKYLVSLYPRIRYLYKDESGKIWDRQKRMPGFEILRNDELYNLDFNKWDGWTGWEEHLKKFNAGKLKRKYYRNSDNNFLQ